MPSKLTSFLKAEFSNNSTWASLHVLLYVISLIFSNTCNESLLFYLQVLMCSQELCAYTKWFLKGKLYILIRKIFIEYGHYKNVELATVQWWNGKYFFLDWEISKFSGTRQNTLLPYRNTHKVTRVVIIHSLPGDCRMTQRSQSKLAEYRLATSPATRRCRPMSLATTSGGIARYMHILYQAIVARQKFPSENVASLPFAPESREASKTVPRLRQALALAKINKIVPVPASSCCVSSKS